MYVFLENGLRLDRGVDHFRQTQSWDCRWACSTGRNKNPELKMGPTTSCATMSPSTLAGFDNQSRRWSLSLRFLFSRIRRRSQHVRQDPSSQRTQQSFSAKPASDSGHPDPEHPRGVQELPTFRGPHFAGPIFPGPHAAAQQICAGCPPIRHQKMTAEMRLMRISLSLIDLTGSIFFAKVTTR